MIYYVPYGTFVNVIEDNDYELRDAVDFFFHDGKIQKSDWGTGCLYEADEYFATMCVIKYSVMPYMLQDEEYNTLKSCGLVYLSKERKKYFLALREQIRKQTEGV